MKTLVVYSDFQDLPQFFIVDGDKRNWDGVVVNCGPDGESGYSGTSEDYSKAETEICDIICGENPPLKVETLAKAIEIVLRDSAAPSGSFSFYTASCGFAP